MEREKAIDIIKKLLRLQESPNEHEAALAATKAAEFMMKYNIGMVDVIDFDVSMVEIRAQYTMPIVYTWVMRLTSVVAQHFFCKAYIRRDVCKPLERRVYWWKQERVRPLQYVVVFYGRKSNVDVAAYVLDQLAMRLEELALERLDGVRYGRHTFRTSWLIGATDAIAAKLNVMRKAALQNAETSAIVLLRDSEVEEAFKERSAHMKKSGKQSRVRDGFGYSVGYTDGSDIDINLGLED